MTRAPALTWRDLLSVSRGRLTAIVPQIDTTSHPAADLLIAVMAFSQCQTRAKRLPSSVRVDLKVSPAPSEDLEGLHLLTLVKELINGHVRGTTSMLTLPLAESIDQRGFVSFVIALLRAGASTEDIMEMAELVAQSVTAVVSAARNLATSHLKAILARDVPQISNDWPSHSSVTLWLTAPKLSGSPDRTEVLKRRFQAFSIFASLVDVLMEPEITAVIDAGKPLNRALTSRLNLTEAELRSLRGAAPMSEMLGSYHTNFAVVVRELKAHAVPLHEWPGAGRPDERSAWKVSPWLPQQARHLLRADYLHLPDQEVSDALKALRDDLLRPIVQDRARQLFGRHPPHRVASFLSEFAFPSELLGCKERQHFLAALRQAIVGPRGAKSFQEAVTIWHRRAASIAAMRHEQHADRPGWPAICAPWQSPDGIYAIVPLTSAAALVEEGNALDHCVGAYYDPCRRGDTQILSMRREGMHAATIELKLSGGEHSLSTRIGQFRTFRNARPSETLHEVLKFFIGALNRGDHVVDRKTLIAHRKQMRETWDGYSASKAVPLDHARKVFPLYRPLLPRGIPENFDDWRAQIALEPVIDRALHRLARPKTEAERNHVPY